MIRSFATSLKQESRFLGELIGVNTQIGETKMEGKKKTISEEFEDIKAQMCRNYCKYTDTWDEEVMGYELMESEVCAQCPLNRL